MAERTEERRGQVKLLAVLALVVVALIAVVLVVTQFEKWTCGAPDGLWVEASDTCIDLP